MVEVHIKYIWLLIYRWYPPGHGDFYQSFQRSGLLNEMLKEGRNICFVSNSNVIVPLFLYKVRVNFGLFLVYPGDNTGAVVDTNILNKMCESEAEFLMEVTEKTRADVKGGTLIWYEHKLRLLELAQVPRQYQEEFKSVQKFNVFNTNNIWWDRFFSFTMQRNIYF